MKYIVYTLLFLFILPVASCHAQEKKGGSVFNQFYPVKKVIDGDTFWINDGSEKGKKVRLIGIDAPESRNSGRKKIGYFGKESKQYLTNRLKGKKVKLIKDVSEVDRYRRVLAYVYLEDGTFINAELVREGYATAYTYPPDVKYANLFVQLQKEARKKKKGLWK